MEAQRPRSKREGPGRGGRSTASRARDGKARRDAVDVGRGVSVPETRPRWRDGGRGRRMTGWSGGGRLGTTVRLIEKIGGHEVWTGTGPVAGKAKRWA